MLTVGLAIAGVGGVASSKPVATAVVGPGGLAVGKFKLLKLLYFFQFFPSQLDLSQLQSLVLSLMKFKL